MESYEHGDFIFWDPNMWQKIKVYRSPWVIINLKQKFFLSYDMLEQRDMSLPYEDAYPEAAKLEKRGSTESSRKNSGKQIGNASTES